MTFFLPEVDRPGTGLVEATKEALELGIKACGPGKRLNGIGNAIELGHFSLTGSQMLFDCMLIGIRDFAKRHGFSVNAQFAGHGIGRNFHQSPDICHYGSSPFLLLPTFPVWIDAHPPANSDRDTMRVGDCFTIEPSLVQGSNSRGFQWDDGWTMATEVSLHLAHGDCDC
jgi:methionyl aminopeptidase